MYAVVVFLYTVWESHGVFYFRSRFLCFKQPIQKKIELIRNPTYPESFISLAKAPPAKRSEKGYGDENELMSKGTQHAERFQSPIGVLILVAAIEKRLIFLVILVMYIQNKMRSRGKYLLGNV